jgi:hypothetical protein
MFKYDVLVRYLYCPVLHIYRETVPYVLWQWSYDNRRGILRRASYT